jgi:hypothetical protein
MASKQPKLLDRVIENAFDFLETAIEEFDTKPKYSIMHFSTAVELILKARLIDEHWSLIVADKPEKAKFEKGDFRSITIKESIDKIRNVLGDDFPEDYQKALLEIANHRNKLVHFFHDQVGKDERSITEKVAREQCTGWLYLSRLIYKWENTFEKYQGKVADLNEKMKKHHVFLSTVYEKIVPDIDKEKAVGAVFKICPSCQFEACKQSEITDHIYTYKCKVCLFDERVIIVQCPECDSSVEIPEGTDDSIQCETCSHTVGSDYISEQLDTDPVTQDNYFDHTQINCAHCGSVNCVVKHNDFYVCTECRSISEESGYCEWCNEGQIGGGDLEFSYHSGCEFCDGHAGHVKDD